MKYSLLEETHNLVEGSKFQSSENLNGSGDLEDTGFGLAKKHPNSLDRLGSPLDGYAPVFREEEDEFYYETSILLKQTLNSSINQTPKGKEAKRQDFRLEEKLAMNKREVIVNSCCQCNLF